MTTIYRYIQLGVHVRARYDKKTGRFMREVCEVCEFHVTKENVPESHIIYRKNTDGTEIMNAPSEYLIDYLEAQGVDITNKDYMSANRTDSIDDHLNGDNVTQENVSVENNDNKSVENASVEKTNNENVDNNNLEKTQYFDVFSEAEEL
jgi:hypothetical protein